MPRNELANQQIRNEATKRILDAARRVFAKKGSGATMADIATEAGVSQGLAYRYFPSKEAILATLVKESAQSEGGPAERLKKIQGTPGQRIVQLVSFILEDRRERPAFYRFLSQVLSDDSLAPELRETVQTNGRVIQKEIRSLIVKAQETGEIARDDPDQLMTALMAVVDGLVTRAPLYAVRDPRYAFPKTEIILRLLKPDSEVHDR
jgi:AcrR family transcriptional regulator